MDFCAAGGRAIAAEASGGNKARPGRRDRAEAGKAQIVVRQKTGCGLAGAFPVHDPAEIVNRKRMV